MDRPDLEVPAAAHLDSPPPGLPPSFGGEGFDWNLLMAQLVHVESLNARRNLLVILPGLKIRIDAMRRQDQLTGRNRVIIEVQLVECEAPRSLSLSHWTFSEGSSNWRHGIAGKESYEHTGQGMRFNFLVPGSSEVHRYYLHDQVSGKIYLLFEVAMKVGKLGDRLYVRIDPLGEFPADGVFSIQED